MAINGYAAIAIVLVAMAIGQTFIRVADVHAKRDAAVSCNEAKKAAVDKGITTSVFCAELKL